MSSPKGHSRGEGLQDYPDAVTFRRRIEANEELEADQWDPRSDTPQGAQQEPKRLELDYWE